MGEILTALSIFKLKAMWKAKRKKTPTSTLLILDPLHNSISTQKIVVLLHGCRGAGGPIGTAVTSLHVLSTTGSS